MPRREPTVERMSVCISVCVCVCSECCLCTSNIEHAHNYWLCRRSKQQKQCQCTIELGPGQRSGDPFGHPTQSTDSVMSCHLITHSMNIDKGWRGKVLERTHGLSDCLPVSVFPSLHLSPPTQMAREFCIYIHSYTEYIRNSGPYPSSKLNPNLRSKPFHTSRAAPKTTTAKR